MKNKEHTDNETILRLDGITKAYPGVKALDNISFSVKTERENPP